ncbi:MAG: hypothetical protein OHK0039_03020 [Bacteroidia bacterium]
MKRVWPVLVFCGAAWGLYGQNLVPNPGFENYTACPTSSCQWYNADDWNNVNGSSGCTSSTGSPDYFHACGAQFFSFPTTLNGAVTPLGGDAVMGLATWLSLVGNFREYLSVPLASPLQVGTAYTLQFSYTNGAPDPSSSYGGYGTQLSVHFSVGALAQTGAAPISLTPVYESSGPLYSTTWQTVSYSFVPTQAYTHLTIGNFRNDAATTVQLFSAPTSFGYAYYFLDNLSVVEDALLPLEQLTWEARPVADRVVLTWETAALAAPTLFEVERAGEDADFAPVASLEGAPGADRFRLADARPLPGRSYYRLRYRSASGAWHLSDTRVVEREAAVQWSVTVPTADRTGLLWLRHTSATPQQVCVRIWDTQGRVCMVRDEVVASDLQLPLSQLPAGIYVLHVSEPGGVFQQKIMIP